MSQDPLTQVQLDFAQRLRSNDLLEFVRVYEVRPRSEEEAMAIVDQVNQALATINDITGRGGLAILIPMPAFEVDRPDSPGPSGEVVLAVQCLEKMLINAGLNGTGISCEGLAMTVMRLGHQLMLRPHQTLYASRMRPLDTSEQTTWQADVGWEVEFRLRAGTDPLPAADIPTISHDSDTGLVTVTSTTPGSAVYVTTDGSFPGAKNPAATAYDQPFTAPPAGSEVRAVASKPGMADSGAAWLLIP